MNSACLAQGSASMWAQSRTTKIASLWRKGHTVNLDWHVACTPQIVNARTQAVGDAEVRGT